MGIVKELFPGENTQYRKDMALLQRAEYEGGSSDFIDSCEDYLQKNGFLTDKQRNVLQEIADGDPYDGVENQYDEIHSGWDW